MNPAQKKKIQRERKNPCRELYSIHSRDLLFYLFVSGQSAVKINRPFSDEKMYSAWYLYKMPSTLRSPKPCRSSSGLIVEICSPTIWIGRLGLVIEIDNIPLLYRRWTLILRSDLGIWLHTSMELSS